MSTNTWWSRRPWRSWGTQTLLASFFNPPPALRDDVKVVGVTCAFLSSCDRTTSREKKIERKKTLLSMDPGVDCFKNGLFGAKQICLSSLWEELEAKRLTQGHLFGYPGSNELCRSQWHQNCHHSRPMDYFTKAKQKFMKICIFAQKGPYPKTFNVFFRFHLEATSHSLFDTKLMKMENFIVAEDGWNSKKFRH